MTILLLRHVHAGDRDQWQGDDRLRPASDQGAREADALVTLLEPFAVRDILSSPYRRCLDSVAPLAAGRGLAVTADNDLAEGVPTDVIRGLLRRHAEQDVVLCTHGDVIAAAVTDLAAQGVDVGPAPAWPKSSVWLFDGLTTPAPTARYLPPPAV